MTAKQEFLIGKAGAEHIAHKLTQEDPRVFLTSFQAANGLAPSNDTYYYLI